MYSLRISNLLPATFVDSYKSLDVSPKDVKTAHFTNAAIQKDMAENITKLSSYKWMYKRMPFDDITGIRR